MERALGDHPDKGGPVVVKSGRYGHYVSHDGVNAALPKDKAPETVTLAEALPLIAARIVLNGGSKVATRATKEYKKVRSLPEKEEGAEGKKFADKIQAAIEHLLDEELEPKDANALIANGIRLLAVQLKMAGGDDDGFWGNGD